MPDQNALNPRKNNCLEGFSRLPRWLNGKKKKKKNPPANAGAAGDMCSIPGLGRSPGEGNGNPFQ